MTTYTIPTGVHLSWFEAVGSNMNWYNPILMFSKDEFVDTIPYRGPTFHDSELLDQVWIDVDLRKGPLGNKEGHLLLFLKEG